MNSSDGRPLIGSLGDLIEDLVIDMAEPIRQATDTDVRVTRRRGGSAANVAVAAVVGGARARFLGNVGSDVVGEHMVGLLEQAGVELQVTRSGRTGTVIALIDTEGERSLLTDRGWSCHVDEVPPPWLEGLDALHVPAYAFTDSPLRRSSEAALLNAAAAGIVTSVDASAVPVIETIGPDQFKALISRVRPTVLFCNSDEATALGVEHVVPGSRLTVVKNGPNPTVVYGEDHSSVHVEPPVVPAVADTTGAGDAFAAGFLIGLAKGRSVESCVALGHELAATSLRSTGSLQGDHWEREQ